MAQFEIPKLDYIAFSSAWLSNFTRSEVMHNMSVHQLPQYYQQWIPSLAWAALATWYMHCKLACTAKILQKFWLTLEIIYEVNVLYNDCWHGFWVRSWWPHVLWQAVTLWLVNRGMAVHQGRLVEQVCNRKETTWYENHAVRFRQSIQSESRVEPGIRSRSEVS